MQKSFNVEITCPLHPNRKEKVWFEPLGNKFFCNGCDNFHNDSVCIQCRNNMEKLHGGESFMDKQLKEIFQVAPEKK